MAEENPYDLVVIGAGAGGLVAAVGAAMFGAKVVLIERQALLGGDCLHFGCIPSKALIRAAHAAHEVRLAGRFGTHVEGQRTDLQGALEYVRGVVKHIGVHDDAQRFREMGVEILTGAAAQFVSPKVVRAGDRHLHTRAIIIATGSRPTEPPVPGISDANYYDNETIFYKMATAPRRMLVLGGGPIGVELGQAFARLGVAVTLVEVSAKLLAKEDQAASTLTLDSLRAEGLDVRLETKVVAVETLSASSLVTLEQAGGRQSTLEVEAILGATGRRPNVEGLALERAGVDLDDRGYIRTDLAMRTSRRHIYAVGDVIGRYPFTHMAEAEAKVALRNVLFPASGKMNYDVVPWVTFCDPEVARVGPLEADLIAAGTPHRVFSFAYKDADRALTDDRTAGFIKLLTSPKGAILGATIVGAGAGEAIHEYVVAMRNGLNVQALSATIHAYPTFALANRRAADQFLMAKLNGTFGGKLLRWWVGRRRR